MLWHARMIVKFQRKQSCFLQICQSQILGNEEKKIQDE